MATCRSVRQSTHWHRDGWVIGLDGTLGAGKTTLVQSIVRRLSPDVSVTSPTFTIWQSYRCGGSDSVEPFPLHHLDAYRIDDLDAWDELGVDEAIAAGGHVTLIEWADRVGDALPGSAIRLRIDIADVHHRIVTIDGGPAGWLDRWGDRFAQVDQTV